MAGVLRGPRLHPEVGLWGGQNGMAGVLGVGALTCEV